MSPILTFYTTFFLSQMTSSLQRSQHLTVRTNKVCRNPTPMPPVACSPNLVPVAFPSYSLLATPELALRAKPMMERIRHASYRPSQVLVLLSHLSEVPTTSSPSEQSLSLQEGFQIDFPDRHTKTTRSAITWQFWGINGKVSTIPTDAGFPMWPHKPTTFPSSITAN